MADDEDSRGIKRLFKVLSKGMEVVVGLVEALVSGTEKVVLGFMHPPHVVGAVVGLNVIGTRVGCGLSVAMTGDPRLR